MLSDDAEAMSLTMGNAFHVVTKPRDTTPEDKPAISLPTIATFLFGKNIVIDILWSAVEHSIKIQVEHATFWDPNIAPNEIISYPCVKMYQY